MVNEMDVHIEDMTIDSLCFSAYRGEVSLVASKDMDDRELQDSERRSNGSSIDAIITHLTTQTEVCIIEVSGPPTKNDHTHFVQDRKKIARNLKKCLRRRLRNTSQVIRPHCGTSLFLASRCIVSAPCDLD
ncbi:hypothetical protein BCR43DRAFT_498041 [Syncephalastrum racemosum]|uniref:Uncharacterized protein n=1 Tax=Syncephalastrum racemosum TaxID=13706 RepID=A0A1X2H375_SYNRA|nr:hypothetical protein BCR43DRAFT_498041 [Syncephalastrum racemosum]